MKLGRWVGTALVSLALATDEGVFTYAPEPGTELERHWSESLELEVDSLEETFGGSPIELPFDTIEFAEKRSFVLTDALAKCANGKPIDFTRTFTSSALTLGLTLDGKDIGSLEGASACDRSRVRFLHRDEPEGYERERLEGKLDDERLAGLDPDLDLLGLLPKEELAEGASFTPELESLRGFFRAGGELVFGPARIELRMNGLPVALMVAGALGSLDELFAPGGELSGKLEGRFKGKAADDEGLLRLEYHLDVKASAELGERFRGFFTDATATSHDLRLAGEIEGELLCLWDVAAHHFRSARFTGDVSFAGHMVFPTTFVEGQEPQEFVGDYELSGKAEVELVNE